MTVEGVVERMEINVAKHVINVLEKSGHDMRALKNILTEYAAEQGAEQPPQLSIGAWILGGLCTDIFLKIFRKESLSVFPNFYYLDSKLNSFKS